KQVHGSGVRIFAHAWMLDHGRVRVQGQRLPEFSGLLLLFGLLHRAAVGDAKACIGRLANGYRFLDGQNRQQFRARRGRRALPPGLQRWQYIPDYRQNKTVRRINGCRTWYWFVMANRSGISKIASPAGWTSTSAIAGAKKRGQQAKS